MIVIKLCILIIDAIHISLLMRFCRIYIGEYKINKKSVSIFFVALWLFNSFMRGTVQGLISSQDAILFLTEILFLFIVTFFYIGRVYRRMVVTFLIPVFYWGGEWIIICILFQTFMANDIQYILGTICADLLFAILVFSLDKFHKTKQEQERELLMQEIHMYENQFDIIYSSQLNVQSLRHDLKHHLKMLTDMVRYEDKEHVIDYLHSMESFMESEKKYVTSGNDRIDSVLNYMLEKARTAKVDVKWKISIPEHLNVSIFDINVILSNILDNALNALNKVTQPVLYIYIKYDRGILCIDIKNNCINSNYSENTKNKIDPFGKHGYGLNNVRRVVKKYHGNLAISCLDGFFTTRIILYIED